MRSDGRTTGSVWCPAEQHLQHNPSVVYRYVYVRFRVINSKEGRTGTVWGFVLFFKEEGQSSTPPARLRSPAESLSAITTSDPDL